MGRAPKEDTKATAAKASGKGSSAGKQCSSPGKANKPVLMRKKKPCHAVYCINFGPPFMFELYFYQKSNGDNGFTNAIIKYICSSEKEVHDLFEEANFVETLPHRKLQSDDEVARNTENSYD